MWHMYPMQACSCVGHRCKVETAGLHLINSVGSLVGLITSSPAPLPLPSVVSSSSTYVLPLPHLSSSYFPPPPLPLSRLHLPQAVHEAKSRFKASQLKTGIFGMCFREIIYLDSKTAKVCTPTEHTMCIRTITCTNMWRV